MTDEGNNSGTRNNAGRRSGRGRRGRGGRGGGRPDHWSLAQPEFRAWLSNITTRNEYNGLSLDARRELLRDFGFSRQSNELQGLLQRFLASHANPYITISEAHFSRDDSKTVQAASIAYYGLSDGKFCQVLGSVDPNHVSVVNAHIWPRSAAQDLALFDLQPSDVHNERNVLRLQKDIERAFDHRELTFVAESVSSETLIVKILRPTKLSESLTGTTKTFRDIDGSQLLLPSGKPPFRRLLAHHSMVSHKHARAQRWIGEDLSQVEVQATALMAHSLDQEAQNRLRLFGTPRSKWTSETIAPHRPIDPFIR